MSQVCLKKFKHTMRTGFKVLIRPSLENSKPSCKIGRSSDQSHPIKLFQHYVLLAISALETL